MTTNTPPFFQLRFAVYTTLGVCNVLIGLMVAGITGEVTGLLLVPMIASAACALSPGLFYIFAYTDYPVINRAVADVFANLAWTTHEAGLAFYGYLILAPILDGGRRVIFLTLFWALMLVAIAIRIVVNIVEPLFILGYVAQSQMEIVIACDASISFAAIALAECVTAIFLLKTFNSAYESLLSALRSGKLYRYLMRSTQMRLTTLALISVCRAITASLPGKWSDSLGAAGQIDTFVYSISVIFPTVMFIDILSARLISAEERTISSNSLGHPDCASYA